MSKTKSNKVTKVVTIGLTAVGVLWIVDKIFPNYGWWEYIFDHADWVAKRNIQAEKERYMEAYYKERAAHLETIGVAQDRIGAILSGMDPILPSEAFPVPQTLGTTLSPYFSVTPQEWQALLDKKFLEWSQRQALEQGREWAQPGAWF